MNATAVATDLHALFATDADGNVYRVSDPLSYGAALAEWAHASERHDNGRLPHVKHLEVRSVTVGPDRPLVGPEVRSHGRYDGAPLNMNMVRPVTNSRGYKRAEDAARNAWLAFAPLRDRNASQGNGGWFYYPNARPAAQGKTALVRVCQRMRLIVQGVDGRWYAYSTEEL